MLHKVLTNKLREYHAKYGMAILSIDRGELVQEDPEHKLSVWSACDTIKSPHGAFPAKRIREELWNLRNNKRISSMGQGVVWAITDPETNMVYAGVAIRTTPDKAQRLADAGSERIFTFEATDEERIRYAEEVARQKEEACSQPC